MGLVMHYVTVHPNMYSQLAYQTSNTPVPNRTNEMVLLSRYRIIGQTAIPCVLEYVHITMNEYMELPTDTIYIHTSCPTNSFTPLDRMARNRIIV